MPVSVIIKVIPTPFLAALSSSISVVVGLWVSLSVGQSACWLVGPPLPKKSTYLLSYLPTYHILTFLPSYLPTNIPTYLCDSSDNSYSSDSSVLVTVVIVTVVIVTVVIVTVVIVTVEY